MKIDLVQDVRAVLGEGPIWDERSQRLHWVDIHAGLVHRFSPADGSDLVLNIGQPVSAVGLGLRGGLVVAIRDGFGLVFSGSDCLDRVVEVEKDLLRNRMNDGRCDAMGRFWAGTMATRWEDEHCAGALYRLEAVDDALMAARVLGDITVANGIDWAPDGRLMYYIDSREQRVDVFDFDLSRGEITNRRPLVNVPRGDGVPDGLCVDAEGLIWVAIFGGAALHRYTPAGDLDRMVAVPALNVTSCAFGGPDLSSLYITSAAASMSPTQLESYPRSGGLFVGRPGVRGQPPKAYAG